MLVHNSGAIAACLILAEIELPEKFNVDEGAVERHEQEIRADHPLLDNEAIRLLALVVEARAAVIVMESRKPKDDEGVTAPPDFVTPKNVTPIAKKK